MLAYTEYIRFNSHITVQVSHGFQNSGFLEIIRRIRILLGICISDALGLNTVNFITQRSWKNCHSTAE
jgi:hypothetical protein